MDKHMVATVIMRKAMQKAERRARKAGKPFPKVLLIEAEWKWTYRKYKKLYEGLMRDSERLLCLLKVDLEGFLTSSV